MRTAKRGSPIATSCRPGSITTPCANKLKGDVNDARNTTAAFNAQQGKIFGKVHAFTLVESQATRANILQRLQSFAKTGAAGDYVVVFLSGHGDSDKNTRVWTFLPWDFDPNNSAGTTITDKQLLDAADANARQGKKVFIIIDACFCGQVRNNAKPYLEKYQDPKGGGLVVMVSSSADQMSNALGQYSAFAKAFADGMAGVADINSDGKITLDEVRQYSRKRTYELLRQAGIGAKQDTAISWSPSIADNMTLALGKKSGEPAGGGTAVVAASGRKFVGNETLAGYGALTFELHTGGKATMIDAKSTSQGTWLQNGDTVGLFFDNGRVVYSGTINGANASGNASNGRTNWTWTAQVQTPTAVAPPR